MDVYKLNPFILSTYHSRLLEKWTNKHRSLITFSGLDTNKKYTCRKIECMPILVKARSARYLKFSPNFLIHLLDHIIWLTSFKEPLFVHKVHTHLRLNIFVFLSIKFYCTKAHKYDVFYRATRVTSHERVNLYTLNITYC